jgi:mono/diheme cytochrome c family protein
MTQRRPIPMILPLSVVVFLGAFFALAWSSASPSAVQAARVERGKYLVSTAGCHDCHTPWAMGPEGPAPDMTRMLSGHPQSLKITTTPKLEEPWVWAGAGTNTAFHGPWGTTYAMNLTPDEVSGLGIWTEDMFMRAIRLGKHMGQSRPIMPPMPWPVYRNFVDEDLKSIYAYLRTIPAVSNNVPAYEPPK